MLLSAVSQTFSCCDTSCIVDNVITNREHRGLYWYKNRRKDIQHWTAGSKQVTRAGWRNFSRPWAVVPRGGVARRCGTFTRKSAISARFVCAAITRIVIALITVKQLIIVEDAPSASLRGGR